MLKNFLRIAHSTVSNLGKSFMSERDVMVVLDYYGIRPNHALQPFRFKPPTQKEVAQRFNISQSRVQQIIARFKREAKKKWRSLEIRFNLVEAYREAWDFHHRENERTHRQIERRQKK